MLHLCAAHKQEPNHSEFAPENCDFCTLMKATIDWKRLLVRSQSSGRRAVSENKRLREVLSLLAIHYNDGPCWCHVHGDRRPMNEYLCPPHVHDPTCKEARAALAEVSGIGA